MITGYYVPTDGTITFDGHPIVRSSGRKTKSLKPHEVTALGIGRTFQNIRLFNTMSALDNVLVGQHVHLTTHWWDAVLRTPKLHQEEAAARARGRELLSLVGLRDRAEYLGAQPAVRRPAPAGDRPRSCHATRSCCSSTSRPPA